MYLEISQSNRELVVPVQQNRTGQLMTHSKIKVLQVKKVADWFEGPYSETESESEAALVVPVQIQNLTFEFHWSKYVPTKIERLQLAEASQRSQCT